MIHDPCVHGNACQSYSTGRDVEGHGADAKCKPHANHPDAQCPAQTATDNGAVRGGGGGGGGCPPTETAVDTGLSPDPQHCCWRQHEGGQPRACSAQQDGRGPPQHACHMCCCMHACRFTGCRRPRWKRIQAAQRHPSVQSSPQADAQGSVQWCNVIVPCVKGAPSAQCARSVATAGANAPLSCERRKAQRSQAVPRWYQHRDTRAASSMPQNRYPKQLWAVRPIRSDPKRVCLHPTSPKHNVRRHRKHGGKIGQNVGDREVKPSAVQCTASGQPVGK